MKKSILIIEDEANIALAQKIILEEEGHRVHMAKDGKEGLDKAIKLRPDVIILDLMLPKMDGMEVCRRLRENMIPSKIVMVTSKNQDTDEIRGMDLGADDYIMKPFEADELKHVVRQVLQ